MRLTPLQKAIGLAACAGALCAACFGMAAVRDGLQAQKSEVVEVPILARTEEADPEEMPAADEAVLTADLKRLISSYGDAERSLVSALTSMTWTDQHTGAVIAFTGDTWRVAFDDGRSEVGTYAVTSVGETSHVEGEGDGVEGVESRTFSMALGDGHEAEGTLMTAVGDATGTEAMLLWKVGGHDIAAYGTTTATSLDADALDAPSLAALGCGQQDVEDALERWAASHMPSAQRAVWGGTVDRADEAARTVFSLIGPASTRDVTLTVSAALVTVEEVGA